MGFKTVEQAVAAMKFFNHTFLDTNRLEIEAPLRFFVFIDQAVGGGDS